MSATADVLSLSPLHPSLVLSAYADELVPGARIALFGDATLSLTSELIERGAKLVHVFDTDAVRARRAGARAPRRSVIVATLPRNGAPDPRVPEASFDLVLVPDLSFTRDPSRLLSFARRLLAPSGAAIIASPNPEMLGGEGLGYYDFYDAVAASFRRVRMVGQAPFVGYLLAELSITEEPSASIDTSLAGRPEPAFFIALAGQRNVRLDPYTIIELPYRPADAAPSFEVHEPFATIPAPPPVLSQRPPPSSRAVQAAVDAARKEAEARTNEIERERDRALGEARKANAERERLLAKERELEQGLSRAEARAASLQAELEERAGEAEKLKRRLLALEEERDRLAEVVEESQAEVLAFEEKLRERGKVAAKKRHEARLTERLVRELVSLVEELEEPGELFDDGADNAEAVTEAAARVEAPVSQPSEGPEETVEEAPVAEESQPSLAPESAGVPTVVDEEPLPPIQEDRAERAVAELQKKLDNLAGVAARKEAEVIAARWKIAELERRLAAE